MTLYAALDYEQLEAKHAEALERIAELEAESAQWQESCGQNYVRATEAELREEEKDKRIAELKAALKEAENSK